MEDRTMQAEQSTGCPFKTAAEIDFMDPVVQENWFDAYDVIREESPAYFMPQIGMYVLTRYDDIETYCGVLPSSQPGRTRAQLSHCSSFPKL